MLFNALTYIFPVVPREIWAILSAKDLIATPDAT